MLTNRLTLATTIEPYLGRYYSTEYLRKKVLRQTDAEIIEIDMQIEDEIMKGILPDPNAPIDPNTGQPIDPAMMQQPQDPTAIQNPMGEIPEDPTDPTSFGSEEAPKA